MTDTKTFSNKVWWLLAVLWFAAWHLCFTWDAWRDPLHQVPGSIGDNTVMLWNLGWVNYALNHGSPGFWFTNAYFPDGFLFLYGTHTWLDGVLYWLSSPLLPGGYPGTILWANLNLLMATTATGLLVIAALRAWGVRQWPVLMLAASAVAFSWFRMFALTGHYHFFGTHWMLLSLWMVSRGMQTRLQGGREMGLVCAAGFFLGLAFLNDQTMAVFAGILGGFTLVSMTLTEQNHRWRTLFLNCSIFYISALLVAAIHLVPVALAIWDGRMEYSVDREGLRLVDASSLVMPPDRHFIGRSLVEVRQRHGLTWSEGTYLGLVPIIFLGLSSVASVRYVFQKKTERDSRLRVVLYATIAAWVFIIFALGDVLVVGREHFSSLPGRLLKLIPVLNNIRLPQRWVWPAHLCIALSGATIVSQLISRRKNQLVAWAPLALAFLPGIEGLKFPPPGPTNYLHHPSIRLPGLVQAVKQHYKHGGVLVMPVEKYYTHSHILQLLWGYGIPSTITYSARMPFAPTDVPWDDGAWTPESAQWLREKQVSIVVFSFHEGKVEEYQPWIREAKRSIPGLLVLNKNGTEI